MGSETKALMVKWKNELNFFYTEDEMKEIKDKLTISHSLLPVGNRLFEVV